MKILVIFTGGTIGSVVKDDWILNDEKTNFVLLNNYRDITNDALTEFDVCTPYNILSENLSARELNLLGSCLEEKLKLSYDGIIVTHGTDTLLYTASALSYMFSCSEIPVVLVSSDYTLSDVRANGNANFRAAVEFIKSGLGKGVFVSYKNAADDKAAIHCGNRLAEYREATAHLYSIDNEPYAFCDGKVSINPAFKPSESSVGIGAAKLCDNPEILVVQSRPGDNFSYSFDNVKTIILRPYHSATLNTQCREFDAFCTKAAEKNIPMFLVNVYDGIKYASSKLFDELGIEILPFCSFTAIYMKCWLAISLGEDVHSFVKKPIAGEFVKREL